MRDNRVAATLAVGAASLMLFSGTASAAPDWTKCPEGYFCIWNNAGDFAKFQKEVRDLSVPIDGVVFDDKVDSVWNRTSEKWCLNEHANGSGRELQVNVNHRGSITRHRIGVSSLGPCMV